MQQQLKTKIATGAATYAKEKKLSNNDVSRLTGINAGYISSIFRGIFSHEVGGKDTPIGDTHFYKLATWAGVPIKKEYWPMKDTLQFKETIAVLMEAKESSRAFMIINHTGMGKSATVDVFVNKMPLHTYRLTVGDSYKLEDIINELCEKIGVEMQSLTSGRMKDYSLKIRLERIAAKLADINNNGGKPLIIFDEAENLKPQVLKTIKELYDAIIAHCSIVLIGTDQIMDAMLNKRSKNRTSVPQLYRRFKAGIKNITPLYKARDFKPFFDLHSIDKNFQLLLNRLCDNYGELHDYLEPALREADQQGKPLTEEFFRIMYNLPQ